MAIVEKQSSEIKEKSKEQILYRVYPDISRRINYAEKKIEFEISLPGVKKEEISLKALPTWFHLVARRGQMEYSANQSFGTEIVPNKTTAKYDNGLLKITAFVRDPSEDALEIEI